MSKNKRDYIIEVFVNECFHVLAGLCASLLLYVLYRDIKVSLLCFVVSILVDVDHLYDFFVAYGFSFDYKKFWTFDFFGKNQKIILPLHGWEYCVVLFALSLLFNNIIILGVASGLAAHYFVDTFTNFVVPGTYFILYRYKIGFNIHRLGTLK